MSRVTVETVDRVARLARLSLSDEERRTFARQLDEILAYAESIQTLETTDVAAMSQPGAAGQLREDAPRQGLPRELVLQAAPDPADGLYRVPRILGG